jgi:hypothetical protein
MTVRRAERHWARQHDAETSSERWRLLNAALASSPEEPTCFDLTPSPELLRECEQRSSIAVATWKCHGLWPDMLALDERALPDELFALPISELVAYNSHLDGERVPEKERWEMARSVAAATSRQPIDVQALTFVHLTARKLALWHPNASRLWQAAVVVHNSAMPFFTRLWLTRALYDRREGGHDETKVPSRRPPCTPPDQRVGIDETATHKNDDKIPSSVMGAANRREMANHKPCVSSNRGQTARLTTWLRDMTRYFPALKHEIARCLWETSLISPCGAGSCGVIAAKNAAIDLPVGETASLRLVVTALGRASDARPIENATAVLAHMLEMSRLVFLIHCAAAGTRLELATRRTKMTVSLDRIIREIALPLAVGVRLARDADKKTVSSELLEEWIVTFGFQAHNFPNDVVSLLIERQPQPIVTANDIVLIGQSLHIHKLMTIPQVRRSVACFWSLLLHAALPSGSS